MYETGPLYCVKKKNADKYLTGSYSWVAPKLYVRMQDAERVVKKSNRHRDSYRACYSTAEAIEAYAKSIEKYADPGDVHFAANFIKQINEGLATDEAEGPWVIAEVTIQPKEQ